MAFPYTRAADPRPKLGVIALQADRTLEDDMRRLLPREVSLLVSRVPSGLDVTPDTLAAMEGHLSTSAALFPEGHAFDAVGYGCTSGTAQIGAVQVAAKVRAGAQAHAVTEPVSALIAACAALTIQRIAILSPYVVSVSDCLRAVLQDAGIATPTLGSFDEAEEAAVSQIDAPSILAAAETLMRGAEVEALFLSCTNLRTLDVITPLEATLGCPVLSSNLVLAWDMLRLAGHDVGMPRDLL